MLKITFYTPFRESEKIKNAMFEAGAGKIGNYDCCSWEVKGTGQFRPLEGSQPHIGSVNNVELVDELRVEMVCQDEFIHEVIQALKDAHPYETPAYDVTKVLDY